MGPPLSEPANPTAPVSPRNIQCALRGYAVAYSHAISQLSHKHRNDRNHSNEPAGTSKSALASIKSEIQWEPFFSSVSMLNTARSLGSTASMEIQHHFLYILYMVQKVYFITKK